MKKFFVLLTLVALAGAFAGCEGPAGADGKDGTDGTDGIDGLAGLAGENAAETCSDCHNSSDLITGKVNQYNVSGHALGGTAAYGNREGECSECHTSQGFVYYVENGVSSPDHFDSPNQPNCRTCHDIHNTFTEADWALRVTDPVLSFRDPTHTFGDFAAGNLCIACHQERPSVVPAATATGGAIEIDNLRYGAHYASQGSFMDNSAGWQVAGAAAYTPHAHTAIADACVTCHMADGGHYPYGGHTFSITASFHGPHFNEAGCVACHAGEGVAKGKIGDSEDKIDPLIATLKGLLGDHLDKSGYVSTRTIVGTDTTYTAPTEAAPKTVTAEIAGALYNYRMIAFDEPGYAVHNPTLVKALLNNTIDALTP